MTHFPQPPLTLEAFKGNVTQFLAACYPSEGVIDIGAWETSGLSSVWSPQAAALVKPPSARRVIVKTLDQRMRDNDWAFASTPGGCASIEGGHSALATLYLLGMLDRLGPDNRRAWAEYFNQFQDRDSGYYLGPYLPPREHRSFQDGSLCTHPWDHMHDHMIACLCPAMMLLDGRTRYPLSAGAMTGRFLGHRYLEEFLWGRDWTGYRHDLDYRRYNPWWMGNEFWFPAMVLWQITQWEAGTPEAREARRLIDQVWYRWHDQNFASSGYWHGDLAGPTDRLWGGPVARAQAPPAWDTDECRRLGAMALMGGAHQLWFYDFDRHAVPPDIRRRQTDLALALQNRHDRHFGMGDVDNPAAWSNNCTDVDCMTVLACNYRRQDYRRPQIERALHDAAAAILTDRIDASGVLVSEPGKAFAHNFNSLWTYSPAGAGNAVDQSFYLWALIAACAVVPHSPLAPLQTWLDHTWPTMPSPWLWVP